jgi:hypothetical protein
MPLTTEDLAAALDRQRHDEFEEQIREVERQEIELKAQKNESLKTENFSNPPIATIFI